jgi:4-hydroxy 2-oxovalerate aldolase
MRQKTIFVDCTLRDGSYSNKFSFTPKDTFEVYKNLSEAKIKLIEVGHGLGIGAYRIKKFHSNFSDKSHFKALNKINNINSKWGVFCQPTITTVDDLNIIKDYGAGFLRIGTTPKNYKSSEEIIKFANKNKIDFYSFLMASYTVTPKKFAQTCRKLADFGSNKIYIVDSAGTMNESLIEEYYYEIKSLSQNIKIGFHGHNNLGLANANSLYCYKMGFDYLDSTLMGIGRSAGNACTEQILGILKINKKNTNIDIKKIIKFSYLFFKKKRHIQFFSLDDVLCGIFKIHSLDIQKLNYLKKSLIY